MIIAVNTRFLLPRQLEGIGWFTFELTKRLVEAHPEHEFVFLFDRPFDKKYLLGSNVRPVQVFPPARHPLLWWLWYEIALPPVLKNVKADVFVSPSGYLSLRSPIKTLLVLHDLAYLHYPEGIPSLPLTYLRRMVPRFARRAERIVTVSDFCKKDIAAKLNVSPEKIGVVHNACDGRFRPLPPEAQAAVRERYTQGRPYFLYLGAIHPRKNLPRLLRAFDLFLDKNIGSPVQLLIAGRVAWGEADFRLALSQLRHKDAVRHLDYVPATDLPALLGAAQALVYPSIFEGFGMPILEAMQCHTAVMTSTTASMPEVAGDAALLVEPTDEQALAAGLERLWRDEPFSAELRRKGALQAARFSWDKSADVFWEEILQTVR